MKTYYKFIKENIDENIIINQIHLNEFDIRFSFVSPWTNAIVYIYDNDIMIFDIKDYNAFDTIILLNENIFNYYKDDHSKKIFNKVIDKYFHKIPEILSDSWVNKNKNNWL